MSNYSCVGYRISLKNCSSKAMHSIIREYVSIFGNYCELKISDFSTIDEEVEKFKGLKKTFKNLNFSIHLPKDMFYSSNYSLKDIIDTLCLISKIDSTIPIRCIVHFPSDKQFIGETLTRAITINKDVPENIKVLFENPVTSEDYAEFLLSIDDFFYKLENEKIHSYGMCIDIGHLLYCFDKQKISNADALSILNMHNWIINATEEIHVHDYNKISDHLTIGSGLTKWNLLETILVRFRNEFFTIIETNVVNPNEDGKEQLKIITAIVGDKYDKFC